MSIKKYDAEIAFPFPKEQNFLDLTLDQSKYYFDWFIEIKNQRLNIFCDFLFENFKDCLNESNLDIVELFLMNSVYVEQKPSERYISELNDIPEIFNGIAFPDDFVLSDYTICVCFDIGIYFGELMKTYDNSIQWGLEKNLNFADYGQPVLLKKGSKWKINPFRACRVCAFQIHEKTYEEKSLQVAYFAWKESFEK